MPMSAFEKFLAVKRVRISVKFGAPVNETFRESTGYTVTLKYKGRQLTVPFYMGAAHTDEPTAAAVLSCLLMDSESVRHGQTFEEWARDLGYDPDSRKAERTFNACVQSSNKLTRLLGDDYQAFVEAAADY